MSILDSFTISSNSMIKLIIQFLLHLLKNKNDFKLDLQRDEEDARDYVMSSQFSGS